MKIQIDNRIVEMKLAGCRNGFLVYHELNDKGQPVSAHSFASDPFAISPGDGTGFWTNGHHYRVGTLVGVPCDSVECNRCQK